MRSKLLLFRQAEYLGSENNSSLRRVHIIRLILIEDCNIRHATLAKCVQCGTKPHWCVRTDATQVRCDAASLGVPCTNCVAFSIECKIPVPKRKKNHTSRVKEVDRLVQCQASRGTWLTVRQRSRHHSRFLTQRRCTT